MAKLKYTFKHDIVFKMLFVRNPGLLERLVADERDCENNRGN